MTYQHTFIDPSSLSHSSPSPAPESEAGSSTSGSRKRPRTEASSEDRKEARAHRNRIAAQNSRDRRKAQFSYLERRVAELEDENRVLRAGMNGPPVVPSPTFVPNTLATQAEEERKRREARERERENEELKERIKTLERGWDAVMKALAAQGLPLATSAPSPSTPTPSIPASKPISSPTPPTSSALSAPIYPISPAPSPASLDFSPSEQPEPEQKQEPTRHLARVATISVLTPPQMSLQRTPTPSSQNQHTPSTAVPTLLVDDEAVMEDLLREILAPIPPASPTVTRAAALPEIQDAATSAASARPQVVETTVGASGTELMGLGLGAGWGNDSTSELEMQRILAEMGVVGEGYEQTAVQDGYELSDLDVEMGWEMTMGGIAIDLGAFSNGQGVGVF
ncbi:hypothetical protein BDZ94DRAFT_1318833 [Collybia nuda]|uniref:X-box-binding protein 1 n=1 Tax=Collybia nuda TaxID=64659 RepID=A0A9P6CIB5_9AGAR|nr:hypothetical protein BDZ94DRAFT_1318833 [Collybia nuda]